MSVIEASDKFNRSREIAERMRIIGMDKATFDEIMSDIPEFILITSEVIARQNKMLAELRREIAFNGDKFPLYTIATIKSILGDL